MCISLEFSKNKFPDVQQLDRLSLESIRICTSALNLVIVVKFIHSKKATKFCEIFTLLLTIVHTVKSKVKISQNFVVFSVYMNFTNMEKIILNFFIELK